MTFQTVESSGKVNSNTSSTRSLLTFVAAVLFFPFTNTMLSVETFALQPLKVQLLFQTNTLTPLHRPSFT